MYKEDIELIYSKFSAVRKSLIDTVLLTFREKPPADSINEDIRVILRESIIYRWESILFHLNNIKKIENNILKEVEQDLLSFDERIVSNGQKEVLFTFDDLIFSMCSSFDYLGNLIGVIYLNNQKLKWNGCSDACRDINNPLSKYKIAEYIVEQDRIWITHLYKYRSKLIHYKKDNVNSNLSIRFNKKNATLFFKVDKPDMFVSIIKAYSKTNDINNHNIIDLSIWLVKEKFNTVEKMINLIISDLDNS